MNLPGSQESIKEELGVKIEIAEPKDWGILKNLRLQAIHQDAILLGETPENIKKEENYSENEKEMFGKDKITVLAYDGSEAAGMGRAYKKTDTWWHIGWDYVEIESRRKGIQKKMIAVRLNEVRARGGKIVTTMIKFGNEQSVYNYLRFGFQKVDIDSTEYSTKIKTIVREMKFEAYRLDLADPEAITKIEEVLETQSTP